MSLLASKAYDPAAAVTKATSALLAMTAFDTTNLRNTFAAPANGSILVRMQGVIHGAATLPQTLFGLLNGAAVIGPRVPPMISGGNLAATTLFKAEASWVVSGLTPGTTYNLDAAYGVETIVAATGFKYGGANDATANNAFGAFCYEIWTTA